MHGQVFLGLGSNLGDREATIAEALRQLAVRGFTPRRTSSLWATEPVGGPAQGQFLNAAVEGETLLLPEDLLQACLATEQGLGRVRGVPNGPRTIDVDLLFYGELRLARPGLVLPHPRLHERRFVLAPLAEIAAGFVHPALGLTVAELLLGCRDASGVALYVPPGVPA